MFTPRSFREEDPAVLHDLVRQHSFATLFCATDEGPMATHLPFEFHPDPAPGGTLVAHMARANPHWRSLERGPEVLVSFLGPHNYVSPSWYADPVTVPTWNYAAVHVWGVPRLFHDADLLREHVLRLTTHYEALVDPPWDPRHAEPVMEVELKAIVGIEIPVQRIVGKFKFNQNRSRADQQGVAVALERTDDPMHREAAAIMRRHLKRPS